jgi:hypothetical protein
MKSGLIRGLDNKEVVASRIEKWGRTWLKREAQDLP